MRTSFANRTRKPSPPPTKRRSLVTVTELITRHRSWSKKQTDFDVYDYRIATRALFQLYGCLDANDIDAAILEECRQSLARDGHCERQISHYMDLIAAVWRWGQERGLVTAAAMQRILRDQHIDA